MWDSEALFLQHASEERWGLDVVFFQVAHFGLMLLTSLR